MNRLFLIRHGESEANRAGHLQGYGDAALTDLGRTQAEALAHAARGWAINADARLVTSPMQRARDTAAPLAKALGLDPHIDARLTAGEGRVVLDLAAAGAEIADAVAAHAPPGDSALIFVSHRFPLRAFLSVLYGEDEGAALTNAFGNGEALEIKTQGAVYARPRRHLPGA